MEVEILMDLPTFTVTEWLLRQNVKSHIWVRSLDGEENTTMVGFLNNISCRIMLNICGVQSLEL